MESNAIAEYLVKLGFQPDEKGLQNALKSMESGVERFSSGVGIKFLKAVYNEVGSILLLEFWRLGRLDVAMSDKAAQRNQFTCHAQLEKAVLPGELIRPLN